MNEKLHVFDVYGQIIGLRVNGEERDFKEPIQVKPGDFVTFTTCAVAPDFSYTVISEHA